MAQVVENPEQVSDASGTNDTFSTNFTFEKASEVEVWVDVGLGFVLQAEGVDYDLAAGDWLNDGADCVFRAGRLPSAGAKVLRHRRTAIRQDEPFGDTARFLPQASEAAYDRLTRMQQEAAAQLGRAVMVPPGETPPSAEDIRALAGGIEGVLDEATAAGAAAGEAAAGDKAAKAANLGDLASKPAARANLGVALTIYLDNMAPGGDDDAKLIAAVAMIPAGKTGRIVFPTERTVNLAVAHDFNMNGRGVLYDGAGGAKVNLTTATARIGNVRTIKGYGDPWIWGARDLTFVANHAARGKGLSFENPYKPSDNARELALADLLFTVPNPESTAATWGGAALYLKNSWSPTLFNICGINGLNINTGTLVHFDGLCATPTIYGGFCHFFGKRYEFGWATLRGLMFAPTSAFVLYEIVTQAATGATGRLVANASGPDGGRALVEPIVGTFTTAGPVVGQTSGYTATPTIAGVTQHPSEGWKIFGGEAVACLYDVFGDFPADPGANHAVSANTNRRSVGGVYMGAHANCYVSAVKLSNCNQVVIDPMVVYCYGKAIDLINCGELQVRGPYASQITGSGYFISLVGCNNVTLSGFSAVGFLHGVWIGPGNSGIDVDMPAQFPATTNPLFIAGDSLATGTIRIKNWPGHVHTLGQARIGHAGPSGSALQVDTGFAANPSPVVFNFAGPPADDVNAFAMNANNGAETFFRVQTNGKTFGDGAYSGAGADYAEMFPWADGNPEAEDRTGLTVVLVGETIRPAQDGETPIGVVSADPSMVGDAAGNGWAGRFLTDEHGRRLTETVEYLSWSEVIQPLVMDFAGRSVSQPEVRADVGAWFDAPEAADAPDDAVIALLERPVVNPLYDPAQPYVPRDKRPEWAAVGLMGKLAVRDGQPTAPGWILMNAMGDGVSRWLVK